MHLTQELAECKLSAPAPRPDARWRHLVDQIISEAEVELAIGLIEASDQGLQFRSRHIARAAHLIDVARLAGELASVAHGRAPLNLLPAVRHFPRVGDVVEIHRESYGREGWHLHQVTAHRSEPVEGFRVNLGGKRGSGWFWSDEEGTEWRWPAVRP